MLIRATHTGFFRLFLFLVCSRLHAQTADPPSALVYGRVTSSSGTEVAGALVVAYRNSIASGLPALTEHCRTLTDVHGTYECHGLPEGEYNIQALPARALPSSGECAASGSFYPGVVALDDSETISVRSTEVSIIDIVLRCGHLQSVHLVLPAHLPSPSFSAVMKTEWGDLPTTAAARYTPETGQVTMDVEATGVYTISAESSEGTKTRHFSQTFRAPLQIPLAMEEWKEHLIRGTVTCPSCFPGAGPSEIRLNGIGKSTGVSYSGTITKNRYQIPRVKPGEYIVTLGEGDLSAISVSAGVKSLAQNRLVVMEMDDVGALSIEGRRPTGYIRGHLQDMVPENGRAGVVLQSETPGDIRIVPVNGRGDFIISSLQAGSYYLLGVQDVESIPYKAGSFLEHFAHESQRVEVREGSLTETVSLRPIR